MRDNKNNFLILGIFLIFLGGFLTFYHVPYIGDAPALGIFLIVIGVLLLIVAYYSKFISGDKAQFTSGTRRLIKDHCPNCAALIYSKFSKRCSRCGYEFEFTKAPIIPEKKVEEPIITSDVQSFPPISELMEEKQTLPSMVSGSESKTEEIKFISSTSEREIEKSTKICPHCQQKLPIGAKFCARCGKKFEVSEPQRFPPISELIEKNETLEPISTISESKIDEIEIRQSIPVKKEVNGQIIDWLKHQYHGLGRSIQDIADELGYSMIRIRKLLYRSGIIPETKEIESMIEASPIKTEELQPILPISESIEGEDTSKPIPSVSELKKESFNICHHCNAKLPLGVKFCAVCGQKFEVLRPIAPIVELEEELTEEIVVEEAQQVQSVYIRKGKKPRREFPVCRFCGMRIPKNKDFCLQCGVIVKSH